MRRLFALTLAVITLLCAAPQARALEAVSIDGEALVLCEASFIQSVQTDNASLNRVPGTDFSAAPKVEILDTWDLEASPQLNTAAEAPAGNADVRIVHIGAAMETDAIVAYLKAQRGVIAAEPNYTYHAESISSDPYVDLQWGLGGANGIHPQHLWNKAAGKSIVAVIDTGIDYASPDLAGRIVDPSLAFDAYPTNGITPGTDTGAQGHGTHVAGIIAAATNNTKGGAGVMGGADCKIMPVRVFSGDISYASDVVAGIHHIIQIKSGGEPVVAANMSIGGSYFSSEIMRYALTQLVQADILPVRSAGNSSLYIDDNSVYPSIFETPYTTAVAAIDESGAFDKSYSNYSNTCVQIAAPGTDIFSTWFAGRGGYVGSSGALCFDPFENSNTYTANYMPVAFQSGAYSIVESKKQSRSAQPQSGGYASAHSLQFNAEKIDNYFNYCLTLPDSDGFVQPGQTLGLRIRFASDTALSESAILRARLGERNALPFDSMYSDQYELNKWYYFSLSNTAVTEREFVLCLSLMGITQPITVSVDDLGTARISDTAYNVFEGTSMAAPFFTGAYALLRAAMPAGTSLAALRARLIGGSRENATLGDRVNAGGQLDLTMADDTDTSAFAPVIDTIEQSGDTVTVNGWFFGSTPTLTLGAQSIKDFVQSGAEDGCTIRFTLPEGVSGVQTLTLTKGNDRSYRARYDYTPRGNMTVLGELPEPPAKDVVLRDLFAYGNRLYYLISTAEGFSVRSLENGVYSPFVSIKSEGDRAARDDFSTFVKDHLLYVYDFNHIHRFDMEAQIWLSDIDSPYTLEPSQGFCTGAIADFGGRLMLIGGKGTDVGRNIRVYENGNWTDAESSCIEDFLPHTARAVTAGGRLAVFTHNSFMNSTAILVFDGTSWVKRACPYPKLYTCSLAAYGNEVLCFGDADAKDGILAYNVLTDSWRRLPYRGTGLAYTARGAVANRRIYVATGMQNAEAYILQYVDLPSGGSGGDTVLPVELLPPAKLNIISVPKPPATGSAALTPLLLFPLLFCLRKRRK